MNVAAAAESFARWCLARMGWTILGSLPDVPGLVAVVAPHTSNWDFLVGILLAYALGVPWRWRFRFMAKHSLFVWPVGGFLRWLGGMPIDRATSQDVVGRVTQIFKQDTRFLLAVSPEATRQRATHWKSGFYYIALEASVPMVPVALDYGRRECRIGEPIVASGDLQADIQRFRAFYHGVKGKKPELFGEIRITSP
jgi:1-acyl-sn-glycerol-3-phosphate acyltransferase